jgi:hypothetical protein
VTFAHAQVAVSAIKQDLMHKLHPCHSHPKPRPHRRIFDNVDNVDTPTSHAYTPQAANAADGVAKLAMTNTSLIPLVRDAFRKTVASLQVVGATPDNWGTGHDDVMWGAFAWLRCNEVDPDMRYVDRAALYFEWILDNELQWSQLGNQSCTSVLPHRTAMVCLLGNFQFA